MRGVARAHRTLIVSLGILHEPWQLAVLMLAVAAAILQGVAVRDPCVDVTAVPVRGWRELRATSTILALTVAVHLLVVAVPDLRLLLWELAAHSPRAVSDGAWHQLLTSAFLHATSWPMVVLHALFNMIWLVVLGRHLEPKVGAAAFAALYAASAVAGSVASQLAWVGGVGASGAIFGLLGACFAAVVRDARAPAGRQQLQAWLLLLALGFAMPLWWPYGPIGWQAHLGGFLAGLLIGSVWLLVGRRRGAVVLRVAVAALVALLAGALLLLLDRPPGTSAARPSGGWDVLPPDFLQPVPLDGARGPNA